jgi:effector-binding domain-containing protein
MSYEVTLREVPTVRAMTKRFVTSMATVGEDMTNGYNELWSYIQKKGGVPTGDCFALYHDENFDAERMDVEIGFSVAEFIPNGEGVVGREVEGGLCAATTHKGPYDGLEPAYAAMGKWVEENGYVPLTPMRDLYLNDSSTVPPEEILTEILWPVKNDIICLRIQRL